jgi:Tol biopolymer transport system component
MYFRTSLLAILSLFCIGLSGAEFGQNKVQYNVFDWRYLKAPHYSLYFHQNEGSLPDTAFMWIDHVYSTLSKRFSFIHKDPIPVILFASPNYFTQTNIITEIIPEEVGGFTEQFKNRVVVPYDGSIGSLRHVLNHELVHAFVFGILFDQLGGSLLMNSGMQVPLWFNEGLAEYLSIGWDIEADMFLMDMVINGDVPLPGPMLDGYMAYKGGESFMFYLNSIKGDSVFTAFLRDFKQSKSADMSIKKMYNLETHDIGEQWVQELRRIYWPEIGRRQDPRRNATSITSHLELKDHYNLRPRISPDGTKIGYYSDRYDFTRIIICDRKGKILQTIGETGYGGFFETFHPFRSGMCWSPDSKRLAFVTKSGANDELRIIDTGKKRLVKTINTRLSTISSPDWSHDGKSLVFAAIDKGQSDLFLYDFITDSLNRLTNDFHCESDPRFSPDSKKIIFAIDDTAATALKGRLPPYGRNPSDLAYIDLSSHSVKRVTHTSWSEKSPCFSPDGKHVVFVGDRNGIDNLYLMPIDTPDLTYPVTDYTGGSMNPDWANDSSIVFCMFQKQGWDIWLMEKPMTKEIKKPLAPTKWIEAMSDTSSSFFAPAIFPPDSSKSKTASKGKKKSNDIKSSETPANYIIETDSGGKALKDSLTIPVRKDTGSVTGNTTVVKKDTITDGAVPVRPDSVSQKQAVPVTGISGMSNDTASDTADKKREVDTTPPPLPLPRRYSLKFTPDLIGVGVGVSTYYGYGGNGLSASAISWAIIKSLSLAILKEDWMNTFTCSDHTCT